VVGDAAADTVGLGDGAVGLGDGAAGLGDGAVGLGDEADDSEGDTVGVGAPGLAHATSRAVTTNTSGTASSLRRIGRLHSLPRLRIRALSGVEHPVTTPPRARRIKCDC
jgi:hypothetical protein